MSGARTAVRCLLALAAVGPCVQCATTQRAAHPDAARDTPVAAPAPGAPGHPSAWPARPGVAGTVLTLPPLASRHVAPRRIDVWLPPGYDAHPSRRYPVVYVHDGQNLFDPALAYGGVDWGIDEAMTRLIAARAVRPAIVVAVWNTPARLAEYMPQRAVTGATAATGLDGVAPVARADLRGDAYVAFLADELKPAVDRAFRTRPACADTSTMGASMGGLVALYALALRPEVFCGAAALSTHWPAADGAAVDWFARHLPAPRGHRLYFDHGTRTLDARYGPYQQRMDAALRRIGWREGVGWSTQVVAGAAHDERAWRARVDRPVRFLLQP